MGSAMVMLNEPVIGDVTCVHVEVMLGCAILCNMMHYVYKIRQILPALTDFYN